MNIKKVSTDMCAIEYCPDTEMLRKRYGDEAADNNIIWNFRQRLGDEVNILSISIVYIISWEKIEYGIKIPKKIMYLCTYCKN